MPTATQLSVFLENKPGVLAAVCQDLEKRKINIEALSVVDHIDYALVRMVTNRPKETIAILEEAGVLVIPTEVLRIDAPNKPGALGRIASRLARGRVNIDYMYATATTRASKARLFLRVSDVAKAKRLLR